MIRPRSKPRRGRIKDPAFLEWASTQVCCVTGKLPATSHHVRSFGSPKNDRRIIRLIPELHLHDAGTFSIERLGKRGFESFHGINIETEIARLNRKYEKECNGSIND